MAILGIYVQLFTIYYNIVSGMCFNIIQQGGTENANEGRYKTSSAVSWKLLRLEHGYTGIYYTNLSLCICVTNNYKKKCWITGTFLALNGWIIGFLIFLLLALLYLASFSTMTDHKQTLKPILKRKVVIENQYIVNMKPSVSFSVRRKRTYLLPSLSGRFHPWFTSCTLPQ